MIVNMPQNWSAERSVLGILLLEPDHILRVAAELDPRDFYRDSHRRIYELMIRLAHERRAQDLIEVLLRLPDEELQDLGGFDYVAALGDHAPALAGLDRFIGQIRDRARRREVIQFARAQMDAAADVSADPGIFAIWPEPVPLSTPRPPFPTGCLPTWAEDFVCGLAEDTQTPVDLAGVGLLSALGVALRGRVFLEVTPTWRELLTLYTVCALPSGERKSAVFRALTAPIWHWTVAENKRLRADVALNASARRTLETRIKALERAAAKDGDPEVRAQLKQAVEELEALPVARLPRVIVDDVTPEKAAQLVSQHGYVAVVAEEAGIFQTMGGLYHGGNSKIDLYLKGHDGSPHTVDRLHGDSYVIPSARLGMMLSVQPHVIEGLGQYDGFRGQGLLGRILFSVPDSRLGQREANPQPLGDGIRVSYGRRIQQVLAAEDLPRTVRLSPEADALRVDMARELEPRLAGDLQELTDWAGKLIGRTLRIAAILHLFGGHGHPDVMLQDLESALRLQDYWIGHARAAFGLVERGGTSAAQRVLSWLRKHQLERVTMRELRRGLTWRDNDEAWGTVCQLVDLGYLRRVPTPPAPKGGRPPEAVYVPHPNVRA